MQMRLVTDFLNNTVKNHPDKTAFGDGKNSISFADFQKAAFRIANQIIKLNIFKKPAVVYLDKSINCPIAFLGIAYSGNFYTPLDTSMPVQRVEKIMDTLHPSIIITDKKHKSKFEQYEGQANIIIFEDAMEDDYNLDEIHRTEKKIVDTDVLYVLFTSGSTGTPKGVIISHRSVVDYIDWLTERFGLDDSAIIGNQAPFYFDNSVFDIYLTIKNGSSTYIIPKMYFAFPARLFQFLNQMQINTILWVPSALIIPANLGVVSELHVDSLRRIYFAGECMPVKQINVWRKEYPDAEFANLYGPTEITDIATYYVLNRDFNDDEVIPMGYPCENCDAFVLDGDDKLIDTTQVGAKGELIIRGTSLSFGYYNNPEKTKEAFVQNPLNQSYTEIVYRTGDIVHYNEYGELVYDSRKDFQIKHMGHRIELGEIETAGSAVAGVERNCCLYDSDKSVIVMFYTGDADEHHIREGLNKQVPEYMIPGRIIKLKNMPLNDNGKIDRVLLKQQL